MKVEKYRESILKLIERFIRKWKPASVQCPLTIQEHRQHNYRSKSCKTCRWRANIYDGKFADGRKRFLCRGLNYEFQVCNTTDACPRYED